MFLNTTLPQPGAAKLGNISQIVKGAYYRALQINDQFVVYRSATQKLIIEYKDGSLFSFDNQVSAVFENNTFLTSNGKLIWLYKKNNNTKIFLAVFNTATKKMERDLFITNDTGFPSIAIDAFLNRIIIYKSIVAAGTAGHAYIYAYTYTNGIVTAYHDDTTVPIDSQIWLAFKENATGFYRSYRNTSVSKIDHIFHATLDDTLYNVTPAGGAVLVANTPTQLYYPTYSGQVDTIFVLNRDMTQISGWSPAGVNLQSFSPVTIDSRPNLYHADYDPTGYARLFIDVSTQILYDSLTFTAIKLQAPNIITPAIEYPICEKGLPDAYPAIDFSDRQSAFILSNNSKSCVLGSTVYALDNANACLVEPQGQNIHAIPVQTKNRPAFEYNTGLIKFSEPRNSENILWLSSKTYIAFNISGQVIVRSRVSSAFFDSISTGHTFAGVLFSQQTGLIYIRTANRFFVTDGITYMNEYNVTNVPGQLREAFIWNDKLCYRYDIGMSQININTLVHNFYAINYSRSGLVRLTPNPFTGELYLYDADYPAEVRKVIINLTGEDFTDNNIFYPIATQLVDSGLPVGLRPLFVAHQFEIRAVSENEILFIDYVNEVVSIVDNFRHNYQYTGGFFTQSSLMLGSNISIFNGYIACHNVTGLFTYSDFDIGYIPREDLLLEDTPMLDMSPLISYTAGRTYWLGSFIDENSFALYLQGNPTNYLFEFATVGRRFDINNLATGNYSHRFVAVYNTSTVVFNILNILPNGYSRESLADYSITQANGSTRIDVPNYDTKHYKYNVNYVVTEAVIQNALTMFYNQSKLLANPAERCEIYFYDRYLTDVIIGKATLLSAEYSWHSFDRYYLSLSFEVII